MISIDETIRFIEKEYAWILIREPANAEECKIYEAVMTVLSTLEYSKLLTDKFGSLEEALDAEKVVHCCECGIWNSEKEICNKPCESMKWRRANDYCSDGRLYERKFVERLAEIADKFPREYILSANEIKTALDGVKED